MGNVSADPSFPSRSGAVRYAGRCGLDTVRMRAPNGPAHQNRQSARRWRTPTRPAPASVSATPKRSFTVALNMSNVVHGRSLERFPGPSLMTFAPAAQDRALMDLDDAAILDRFQNDLDDVLPSCPSSTAS